MVLDDDEDYDDVVYLCFISFYQLVQSFVVLFAITRVILARCRRFLVPLLLLLRREEKKKPTASDQFRATFATNQGDVLANAHASQ